MHQRIGFYTSKKKRLFALAYYGIVLAKRMIRMMAMVLAG